MAALVPNSRPQQPRSKTEALLKKAKVDTTQVALLGMRGYYLNTMGEPGKNDRGIFDDAIILISPEAYVTFNANCDPSLFRPGIANLKPGLWQYKLGIHGLNKPVEQQYQALVQAAPVTVVRDKEGEDAGMFGINIHRGGNNTTSSLGCQTIYRPQWEAFINLVKDQLKRYNQKTIPYLLVEQQG